MGADRLTLSHVIQSNEIKEDEAPDLVFHVDV